jgi:hypothetical protein
MAHRIPEKTEALSPLRVLPRGTALVQDYRALHDTLTTRFHGWKWDGKLGPEVLDPAGKGTGKHHGGRVKQTDKVVEIAADDPYRTEYVRHLKDGDLWAADFETARAAGVPFEPDFLDEHPATTAALKKPAEPETAPESPKAKKQ